MTLYYNFLEMSFPAKPMNSWYSCKSWWSKYVVTLKMLITISALMTTDIIDYLNLTYLTNYSHIRFHIWLIWTMLYSRTCFWPLIHVYSKTCFWPLILVYSKTCLQRAVILIIQFFYLNIIVEVCLPETHLTCPGWPMIYKVMNLCRISVLFNIRRG